MVAAAVVFGFPLAIWLRYARQVSGSGGLYSFTEAAAGRRVALVQAGLWTSATCCTWCTPRRRSSTTRCPPCCRASGRYQTLLEIVIPVALAGVMIAGPRVALLVTGAARGRAARPRGGARRRDPGQRDHPGRRASAPSAPAGSLAIATGQTALLYICGSLPFFLGGELGGDLRQAFRTIRRGLLAAYLATVVVIIAAVAPLAADPALDPGRDPGHGGGRAFVGTASPSRSGIGVAVSVAGVILVEYLALSRLAIAVTSWPLRRVIIGIGVIMVAFAPVHAHQPGQDLRRPAHAVAGRAVAQPAHRLRGLPAVRRPAAAAGCCPPGC